MDIFDELGIKKYINAQDTYTIYGGSRISEKAHKAMKEIASGFVDIAELQEVLGKKIASLTGNQDAYISNGSAGALTLCTAVAVAKEDEYAFFRLPEIINEKDEVIIIKSQRSVYAKAIEVCGVNVVEIGNADETLAFELEGAINNHTAAVFFFDNLNYKREELDLAEVITIAHAHDIPVIVDAAANLPPKSNLTYYTAIGADMVIFSGGKTLMGPQDSGIVFGPKTYMDLCRKYGAPNHGICRGSKTSREAMVGLYVAIKEFMNLDEEKFFTDCMDALAKIDTLFHETFTTKIVDHGSVGQAYPRLFIDFHYKEEATRFRKLMLERQIFVGIEGPFVYYNPLNLRGDEIPEVLKCTRDSLDRFYEAK